MYRGQICNLDFVAFAEKSFLNNHKLSGWIKIHLKKTVYQPGLPRYFMGRMNPQLNYMLWGCFIRSHHCLNEISYVRKKWKKNKRLASKIWEKSSTKISKLQPRHPMILPLIIELPTWSTVSQHSPKGTMEKMHIPRYQLTVKRWFALLVWNPRILWKGLSLFRGTIFKFQNNNPNQQLNIQVQIHWFPSGKQR